MHKDKKLYKVVMISKNKKTFRKIYVPEKEFKSFLSSEVVELEKIYLSNVIYECDHAFTKGKNCVTNASAHVGQKFFLTIDIENFFGSINFGHLKKYLEKNTLDWFMVDECLPQGFPTSPCLSNIAMIQVDKAIVEFLKREKSEVVYTRYADDLTFSTNQMTDLDYLLAKISNILRFFGLKIKKSKTRKQNLNNGRVIVTGVAVSESGILPTRKTIKKIRAARHQGNLQSLQGLLEWSLCKKPKNFVDFT